MQFWQNFTEFFNSSMKYRISQDQSSAGMFVDEIMDTSSEW